MSYPGLVFDGDDPQAGAEQLLDQVVLLVVQRRAAQRAHVGHGIEAQALLRGRAEDVLGTLQKRGEVKGEITLLIGKAEHTDQVQGNGKGIGQRVRELMKTESLDEKAALKQAAKEFGVSKSEAYRELQRVKA